MSDHFLVFEEQRFGVNRVSSLGIARPPMSSPMRAYHARGARRGSSCPKAAGPCYLLLRGTRNMNRHVE